MTYTTDQVIEAHYVYEKYVDHNISFKDWLKLQENKYPVKTTHQEVVNNRTFNVHNVGLGKQISDIEEGKIVQR